jgi:hypothetical protein
VRHDWIQLALNMIQWQAAESSNRLLDFITGESAPRNYAIIYICVYNYEAFIDKRAWIPLTILLHQSGFSFHPCNIN